MVKGNLKSNKQDQGALKKLHSTRDPPGPHSKAELQNTVLGAAPESWTLWNQLPPCPAGAQEAQVKTERARERSFPLTRRLRTGTRRSSLQGRAGQSLWLH